jgi:phage baseplate assembly protein W
MADQDAKNDILGCGWSFPPTFSRESGCVEMVSDDQDIRQSLQVLFTTIQGERIMLPEYGSRLQEYVFENINETLLSKIQVAISEAVLYYEPRITVLGIDIEADDSVAGMLTIKLAYLIRQTNTRSNMVYPFYLQEGSNVRQIPASGVGAS